MAVAVAVVLAATLPHTAWASSHASWSRAAAAMPPPGSLGAAVDPFIGTGGAGFGIGSTPPGAQVPFGLARVSPDTTGLIYEPFNHFGGYYYDDAIDGRLRAFSHLHMQGAGVPDLGLVGFMLAKNKPELACASSFDGCWASRFSHARERAFPGFYAVELADADATVELTAAPNSGVHRYTLAASTTYVAVIPSHTVEKGACKNASLVLPAAPAADGSLSFSGSVVNAGSLSGRGGVPGGGIEVFFAATLVAPPSAIVSTGVWLANGPTAGGWIEVSGAVQLELFVGLSLISAAQAAENLAADLGPRARWSFDSAVAAAIAAWEAVLSNALVEDDGSGDPDAIVKYYTLVYHAHSAPTSYTEAGGKYMGFDMAVHTLDAGHKRYASDMSIWDIFRAQVSVLALLQPEYLGDVIHSLDLMRAQGGAIPRWPLAYVPTGCMIGTHADFMVAEAVAKGVTNFNLTSLYNGFKAAAMGEPVKYGGRSDAADYIAKGYVCSDKAGSSVSRTLAYAADDWAISMIAAALGNSADAAYFGQRAQTHFVSLFNADRGIFCGKTCAGDVVCPPNDWDWGKLFTEGNARQWMWFVPQNASTLVHLLGGPDAYLDTISAFLYKSFDDPTTLLPNPYYWAGNEPDLLVPWQPVYVPGGAAVTQQVTRRIFDQVLTAKPGGIPGNDDYGAESASFLHAALGFYPLAGTDQYILGAPRFNRVHLEPINTTIVRTAPSPASTLVDHVLLNGNRLAAPFITHADLANAVLEFVFS